MPTSRARHTLTETDELARALDDAARHWPLDAPLRGKLLVHLVREGHRSIRQADAKELRNQEAAVQRTAGALTGTYPAGYLSQLRDDWPA